MGLQTLTDIDSIDGFKVHKVPKDDESFSSDLFDDCFITVDHQACMLGFLIQDGPIKEVGLNGCQIDTILKTCLIMLEKLNYKIPCQENDNAINHLERAIEWLEMRKQSRQARGVEGTSKA